MKKRIGSAILLAAVLLLLSGCGAETSVNSTAKAGGRETRTEFREPVASGENVLGNDLVKIDVSNTSDGYLMVENLDSSRQLRIQLSAPDGENYGYYLSESGYATFPFSAGSGDYKLTILQWLEGDLYAVVYTADLTVALSDEFAPFLLPNQYVWYTEEDDIIALAKTLSDSSGNDLDFVTNVYHYIIKNVEYDYDKAENVSAGYLPNVDDTIHSGKGICFDYASAMTAILRSQGVPTKLVVGYAGTIYHAWINVWLEELGWVDKIVEFNGTDWELMDPTLAASNQESFVKKYTDDASNNYTVKYCY